MGTTDQDLVIKLRAEMDAAIKEINKLNKEMDSLTKTSKVSSKSFKENEKAYKSVETSVTKLTKQLGALGAAYLSLDGAKAIVNIAADMEQGFIGVAKTTGLFGTEMKSLEDGILDLSTSIAGVSTKGLIEIAETAGQLGVKGTQDILDFTEVVAKMSTATELSAGEAADAFASLGTVLKEPIGNYEKLGSAMNELSATSNATVNGIVDISKRMGGMATVMGLTSQETLALAATIENVGLSSEVGASAVSKMISEMIKNTKGFASAAGVEFNKFASMMENEPIKAIEAFLKSLNKMDKTTKIKTLDDLGLAAGRTMEATLKLSGATDKLTTNIATSNKAYEENISLQKEVDTASKAYNAQMELLENTLKKLWYKIGVDLLPGLITLAKQTTAFINSMDLTRVKAFGSALSDIVALLAKIKEGYGALPKSGLPDNVRLPAPVNPFASLGNAIDLYAGLKLKYEEMFDASKKLEEQTLKTNLTLAGTEGVYVGTSEGMETLKKNILSLIEEHNKLIGQWVDKSPTIFKDKIEQLQGKVGELADAYSKLDDGALIFDKIADSTKKAAAATKQYTEDEIKELSKINNKRVKETESSLKSLEKSEQKLASDIVKINEKLIKDLSKIANDRFKMNQDIESKIADLKRGALSEDAAYYDRQREAEQALSDAKIALKQGEYEKYQYFIDQYQSLVTDSAGQEIKIGEKVAVTKEETRKRAIEGLGKIKKLENDYYDKQEADARAAHAATVQQKQIELDATIALMEAQKASLELMKQLAEELTGKKLDIDTSVVDASIEKAKALKLQLDNVQNSQTRVNVDSTTVDNAKQKIEALKTITINGITLEVDANTNPADFKLKKLITTTDGDKITMDVNPEYEKAQKELDAFRNGESGDSIIVGVDADTAAADTKIVALKQPTGSEHTVKPNANSVISTINKLKQPTSSVHTIYERVVSSRAGGGPIPQRLATGGRFTGSGRVPGYDPTDSDKVNAKLTGGEFVIKRSAVNVIGVPALNRLNNIVKSKDVRLMRVPRLPGYATGGLVDTDTAVTKSSPSLGDLGTLTLQVGGQAHHVLAPREVAEALQVFLNSEGGL